MLLLLLLMLRACAFAWQHCRTPALGVRVPALVLLLLLQRLVQGLIQGADHAGLTASQQGSYQQPAPAVQLQQQLQGC
jgi:hypothetical protein